MAALLVVLATAVPVLGQDDTLPSPSEVVVAFMSAYNAHDIQSMRPLVHVDVEWLAVEGDSVAVQTRGVEELLGALEAYFAAIPSSRSSIESMMEAGRFVSVWERAHWVGQSGEATQSALAVYEVTRGQVRRVWYYPSME